MRVNTTHPAYSEALPKWVMVDDVCEGGRKVKSKSTLYLPMVGACGDAEQNQRVYDAYRARAVFFEVTKDTLHNHVGLAFSEDPTFVPDGMDFLKSDADGAGKSIYQIFQTALDGLLRHGRGGLLVDYPVSDKELSQADVAKGEIRPTITHYSALQIINWRVKKVGNVYKVSMIVLKEEREEQDPQDKFKLKTVTEYRVLELDEFGFYSVQLYTDDGKLGSELVAGQVYNPTKANGSKWTEIPFIPVGSQSNDFEVDDIPLESLAEMNLAHYRNSAEYENSVFFTGQVQPVISNLDEQQAEQLNKSGIKLGSNSPLTLWGDAKFEYVQAKEVMIAKEAMGDKFKYMQSLGAKVLDRQTSVKTATQVDEEAATQHSVLSLCVSNLNEAAEFCLQCCAEFHGSGDKAVFSIKQDFARGKVSLEELKFYAEQVDSERLSKQTFHVIRTTGKVPEVSYEEEQKLIELERNSMA